MKALKFLKGFSIGIGIMLSVLILTWLLLVISVWINGVMAPYFGLINPAIYVIIILVLLFSIGIGWIHTQD